MTRGRVGDQTGARRRGCAHAQTDICVMAIRVPTGRFPAGLCAPVQPAGACAARPSLILLLSLRMRQVTAQLTELQVRSPRIDPDVTPAQRRQGAGGGGGWVVEPTPEAARGTSEVHYNQQTDHVVSSCCS